jgi:hypothetical protein
VSELSSAFMTPKSDLHVQFAYYQSALVVEYLVNRFGFEKLKGILRDLALGVNINDAIPKHTAPMNQVEKEFAAFAKAKAEALGPGLDWTKPETGSTGDLFDQILPGRRRSSQTTETAANSTNAPRVVTITDTNTLAHSPEPAASTNQSPASIVTAAASGKSNYWQLVETATRLIAAKNWQAAKAPLNTLISLCPDQSGPNSAYAMLAAVPRNLNETQEERAALEKFAAAEADALTYLRLMELAEATNDWLRSPKTPSVSAVNPLLPQPYRHLARPGRNSPDRNGRQGVSEIVAAGPADPAGVNFRLAQLLRSTDATAAKRHVLQALDEAPRFRAAHRLLLEFAQDSGSPTNSIPPTPR